MNLQLRQIRLQTAEFCLEVDVGLEAQVTGIIGPSGSGKTTLIDIIAGLRIPDSARIELDGRTLTDSAQNIAVPVHRREIGYVPQDLALFPHLTVRKNLLYGHRETGAESQFNLPKVAAVLEIGGFLDRRIHQLSGGEKQRVALARALLCSPKLLLLDEPLASIDVELKHRILPYLRLVRESFPIPMIYVTHDRGEVESLCDEVVAISQGKITGRGRPHRAMLSLETWNEPTYFPPQ